MERYKNGDTSAFEILFTRHSTRINGYLAGKLRGSSESADLVQDVFIKLHRSRHLFQTGLPFLPWLFTITRSVLLDFAKKRRLEDATDAEALERLAGDSCAPTPAPQIDLDLINRLPEAQRNAVRLRLCDDATFEEIATRLSTSPENARQLVSRGLRRLKSLVNLQTGEKK